MKRISANRGVLKGWIKGFSALGSLEQEIMDFLWARGEASGKDVFNGLKGARPIAITTVLTVLDRLAKKGIVEKRATPTVYIFKPAHTREEFGRRFSREVFRSALELSRSSAAASFVDMLVDMDADELHRLERLIEMKKKEMKARTKG